MEDFLRHISQKMLQSGVGSMQGSNEDCLPMKGHTRGGTHPQYTPTNGHIYFHRGGGRTHNVTQRTDTHIFTGGGTHPQCNPTNRHTNFFYKRNETKLTKLTDKAIY